MLYKNSTNVYSAFSLEVVFFFLLLFFCVLSSVLAAVQHKFPRGGINEVLSYFISAPERRRLTTFQDLSLSVQRLSNQFINYTHFPTDWLPSHHPVSITLHRN